MKVVEAITVNHESSMVFRQSKLLSILHGPEFDGQVKTVMIIHNLSLMFTSSLSLYLV